MRKICIPGLAFALGALVFSGCAQQKAVSGKTPEAQAVAPAPEAEPENVFVFVEQPPMFPGGESALIAYLKENINYPEAARTNHEQGRVMVQFVVLKDGRIAKSRVLRGVSETIDREALRVVNAMPRWTPGKQNGQVVNVQYLLPITFAFD